MMLGNMKFVRSIYSFEFDLMSEWTDETGEVCIIKYWLDVDKDEDTQVDSYACLQISRQHLDDFLANRTDARSLFTDARQIHVLQERWSQSDTDVKLHRLASMPFSDFFSLWNHTMPNTGVMYEPELAPEGMARIIMIISAWPA